MLVGANKQANLQHAADLVRSAANAGARLICLPECFNSPYGTQFFAEYAESVPGDTTKSLAEMAKDNNVYLVGGSIPERSGAKLYNTSCVFDPQGEMIAKFSKIHLFDIDIPGKFTFKESSVLSPGDCVTTFKVDGFTVGLGICYDIRFAELAQVMRSRGCHVLLYPGAFNMTTGPVYFELLTRARAVDNQVYCASIAPARDTSAGYVSYAHSVIVAPTGQVLKSAEAEETTIIVDLDMQVITDHRQNVPTSLQKRGDVYSVNDCTADTC